MLNPCGPRSHAIRTGPTSCERRTAPVIRRGTATVELALITPFLMLLTLGTLDVCSLIFLKETISLAAYEGARTGTQGGNTDNDARDRVASFLQSRSVQYSGDSCVEISKPGFDHAETLEHVTVTVTVPARGNLLIAPHLFDEMKLTSRVTMRKEYQNPTTKK
ncbi:pilus assembly protein [bacterium]|nr:pilus assembly protein [bacterium]